MCLANYARPRLPTNVNSLILTKIYRAIHRSGMRNALAGKGPAYGQKIVIPRYGEEHEQ